MGQTEAHTVARAGRASGMSDRFRETFFTPDCLIVAWAIGYTEIYLVAITGQPTSALSKQNPSILGQMSKSWALYGEIADFFVHSCTSSWGSRVLSVM
jgi:hypothetical protein